MPTVADITADLDAFAPRDLAAEWDNVGLLLGDLAMPVQRILTCLTVTPEVATEAATATAWGAAGSLVPAGSLVVTTAAPEETSTSAASVAAWCETAPGRRASRPGEPLGTSSPA